jgi:hypothetical protein
VEGGRYDGPTALRSAALKTLISGFGTEKQGQRWSLGGQPRVQDPMGYLGGSPLDSVLSSKLETYAAAALEEAVLHRTRDHMDRVLKGFSPMLGEPLSMMARFSPSGMAQQMLRGNNRKKTIALASPLASGFVPFDLMPFVRTIYPVYTLLRNKIARVPGQGTFHRAKILASITGSLPGSLGTLQDDSTSEFFGGSFGSWPNALPPTGAQTAYDLIVPYKFFALTEGVSWLAQFAGQGFDDVFGLSALILLQEFMLLEEHDMLASSSQALTTPATATAAARAAGTGEIPITFTGTNVYIAVTALDFWGETIPNATYTAVLAPTSGTSVIDLTVPVVPGALGYKAYIGTGSSQPARTAMWQFIGLNTLAGGTIGAAKFTIQGALPTSGNVPPAADSGTGSSNRMESLIAVISGRSYNAGSGPYPGPGSTPAVNAGFYANNAGTTLNVQRVQYVLQQMFNGPTGYFANPSELIASPNDATTLNNSILNENIAAYQLRVQQTEVSGVTGGVAVSNIVNPVTRSMPEIVIHPYLPQGSCLYMSYTLPQTQNNLGNVVENVMVQDYAQIGWPVIDPTFRQSILRYGLMWVAAPQYLGLDQGLQQSSGTTTPYF